jgi:hypothetical protein
MKVVFIRSIIKSRWWTRQHASIPPNPRWPSQNAQRINGPPSIKGTRRLVQEGGAYDRVIKRPFNSTVTE